MDFKYRLSAPVGSDANLGFQELNDGFSVWFKYGAKYRRKIVSANPLTWRTACEAIRTHANGWIQYEIDICPSVTVTGLSGWKSELLVLCSLDAEAMGYEDVLDELLTIGDDDLSELAAACGTFYTHDTLQALRDVFSWCPGSPVTTWRNLGGDPDSFLFDSLFELLEEEHERELLDIEKKTAPYRDRIQVLVKQLVGERPTFGATNNRIYDENTKDVLNKIVGFILREQRFPSLAEAKEL